MTTRRFFAIIQAASVAVNGAWLLAGCGKATPVALTKAPSVIASIVPNSSYELDAFDIQGNYAYILGDNGLRGSNSTAAQFYVVNIANPNGMSVASTTPVIGSIYYGQSGIRVQGQYAYLVSSTGTASTNLLQIYDVTNPASPAFVGSVPIPLYGFGLWVSGKYAYVLSYVGDSQASALTVVDVSSPSSPVVVGSATTGTVGLHVADIKVVGSEAYVAGQSGQQSYALVFDVSNPASPSLVDSTTIDHSPQGLDVAGGLWYQSVYDANELVMYDLSKPSSPTLVSSTALAATCFPQDVSVNGATAYLGCYKNSSIAVVDVSKPASPTVESYIPLPGNSYPIFLASKGQYVYSISNTTGGMLSVIDTGS